MPVSFLKKLAVTCGVLLLIWLGFLYRQVPHNKTPFAKMGDKVEQIQLGQGPAFLYLRKQDKMWTVSAEEAGPSYPVDEERLHTHLSGLENVELEDVISERKESAGSFQVDNSGLRVTLRDKGGKVLGDGVFGKQADDSTHIYFRFAEGTAIYLARGLFRGELGGIDLNGWRNHNLIPLNEGEIAEFQIQSKGNTVEVKKKSSDSWTVNNEPADSAKVKTWLGAALPLRVDDFALSASTDVPQFTDLTYATLTLKAAAKEVTVHIGALDPKGKRYPLSTAPENGIAWISEPRAKALLLTPQDFKAK